MKTRTLISLFVASLTAASVLVPRAGAELAGDVPVAAPSGVGETLVLVVAAQAPSGADALGARDAANERFGSLQGFYVDAGDAYDVTGALVQVTPDALAVQCPKPNAVFEAVVADVPVDLECPANTASVQMLRPIGLEYVSKPDYASFAFPSPCGDVGQAPCQHDRYRSMLGDDLGFRPDAWLLVSAFRTKRGAEEFVELSRSAGVGDLVVVQARKLGGSDVGLGQEPHPDGSGALLGPLPDQESYQR